MPATKRVSEMTPFCETVLYSTHALWKENEEGISTIFCLQKNFPGCKDISVMHTHLVGNLSLSYEPKSLDGGVTGLSSLEKGKHNISNYNCNVWNRLVALAISGSVSDDLVWAVWQFVKICEDPVLKKRKGQGSVDNQGSGANNGEDNEIISESVSVNSVVGWLEHVGFGRYAGVFEMHEVDEEALPLLTLNDLKEMGVLALGSRRKLYAAICGLKGQYEN
ncbi:sterile alpha motif domain-containing protein [Tanacetum coccineum]